MNDGNVSAFYSTLLIKTTKKYKDLKLPGHCSNNNEVDFSGLHAGE